MYTHVRLYKVHYSLSHLVKCWLSCGVVMETLNGFDKMITIAFESRTRRLSPGLLSQSDQLVK